MIQKGLSALSNSSDNEERTGLFKQKKSFYFKTIFMFTTKTEARPNNNNSHRMCRELIAAGS